MATNTRALMTPEQTIAKTGRPGRLCYTGCDKASRCHITGRHAKNRNAKKLASSRVNNLCKTLASPIHIHSGETSPLL